MSENGERKGMVWARWREAIARLRPVYEAARDWCDADPDADRDGHLFEDEEMQGE